MRLGELFVITNTAKANIAEGWGASMKKLINSPDSVVTDALAGMAAAYPGRLSVDIANKVVSRAGGPEPGRVGLRCRRPAGPVTRASTVNSP